MYREREGERGGRKGERERERENNGPSSLITKNKNFQCMYITQALLLISGNVLNRKLEKKEQADANNPNKAGRPRSLWDGMLRHLFQLLEIRKMNE